MENLSTWMCQPIRSSKANWVLWVLCFLLHPWKQRSSNLFSNPPLSNPRSASNIKSPSSSYPLLYQTFLCFWVNYEIFFQPFFALCDLFIFVEQMGEIPRIHPIKLAFHEIFFFLFTSPFSYEAIHPILACQYLYPCRHIFRLGNGVSMLSRLK